MHTHLATRTPCRAATVRLLLGAGLLGMLLGPVRATPALGQTEKPSMTLIGQSLALGPGEAFELRLNVSGISRPETAAVTVTLHERVRTRTRFNRTLDGSKGQVLRSVSLPIAALTTPAGGPISLTVPVNPVGQPDNAGALPAVEPGVYPVSVALQTTDSPNELERLTTYLVRAPDTAAAPPLRVALVQPFGAPPALTPTGAVRIDRAAQVNLDAITQVLQQFPTLPLTVAPTPETLDALASLNSPVPAALAKALQERQLVAGPYVGLDLPSFDTSESLDRLLAQRAEGLTTMDRRLERRVGARTWVHEGPLDEQSLGRLVDLGIDRVIVPEEAMAPLSMSLTLARPFLLQDAQGRRPEAVSINDALGDHLRSRRDPVLGAYHLMADLAVLYFESPGTQRGVVLRPPAGTPTAPEALQVLLSSLGNNPLLVKPVTLDDFFEQVEPAKTTKGDPLLRRFTRPSVTPSHGSDAAAETLQHDLEAVGTLVGSNDPAIALARRLSLVSDASALEPDSRRLYRANAQEQIDGITERIRVVDRGTFRLTDRKGTVPITLTNTEPGSPAKVRLHLESDKLDFLDGDAKHPGVFTRTIVLNKANTTLEVPVRYRTPGAFPLEIKVTTPDGRLVLVEGRFEVRSTAISGVGVILSLGAGLFLMLWWARHWRSARRAKRLVSRPDLQSGRPAGLPG